MGTILFLVYLIVVTLFANGKLKANVAPIPSLLFSAQILPPCPSIMFLEINSPKPVPWNDFDSKFTK